jgi:Flp pilus assembly protein TadB
VVSAVLAGFAGMAATIGVFAERGLAPGLQRLMDGEAAAVAVQHRPERNRLEEARTRALRLLTQLGQSARPAEGIEQRLRWAGLSIPPTAWQALPPVLGMLGVVAGLGASLLVGHAVLLAVGGMLAGVLGPNLLLSRRLARRKTRIARDILTYSEYLAMAMRAGAAYTMAIRQVQDRFPGPVADAFAGALMTVSTGGHVDEGLRLVQQELSNPDVDAIIDVLRQNIMLGAQCADLILSAVQVLRRQRTEQVMEVAGKATLLLLLPLAIFDLPAVFAIAVFPMMHQALGALHGGAF